MNGIYLLHTDGVIGPIDGADLEALVDGGYVEFTDTDKGRSYAMTDLGRRYVEQMVKGNA